MNKYKSDIVAVSEVLGTILMVVITVVMFSFIAIYVYTYPPPAERTYVNLDASLSSNYINITHKGGESIKYDNIDIHISINDISTRYRLIDSNGTAIGIYFEIGEVWSRYFGALSSLSKANVIVVSNNEIIYDETLQYGGIVIGNNPPIVGFAWCSPNSVSADGSTTF